MTDTVAVTAPDLVGSNVMAKVMEMLEKLEMEYLSLHGKSDSERLTHACAFMDKSRLQQNRKWAVCE